MAWTQYNEPLLILNTEDVSKIYANMVYVRNLMISAGKTVGTLRSVSAPRNTRLQDVVTVLNNIEYNIDVLNLVHQSQYFGATNRFESLAPNKEQVWRWLQILNDLRNQFDTTIPNNTLKCTNGYPTINGAYIVLK